MSIVNLRFNSLAVPPPHRSFLVIVIVFCFLGCVEEIKERPPNLGPEVNSQKIDTTLINALSGTHPYSVKINDFHVYDFNARVENAAPIKLKKVEVTVIDRISKESSFELVLLRKETTYLENGDTKKVETEIHDVFANEAKTPTVTQNLALALPFAPQMVDLFNLAQITKPEKVTYHNLTVEQALVSPPLRTIPDSCLPPNVCKIAVTNIRYDVALWPADGTPPEVLSFETSLSAETHFYAVEIYNCLSQTLKQEGGSFLLRRCLVLRDYSPQSL